MKQRINFSRIAMITILFVSLLVWSSCKKKEDKKCCEGYTDKLDNADALKLKKACHFIKDEVIKDWVARYREYRSRLDKLNGIYENKDGDIQFDKMQGPVAGMDTVAYRFLRSGRLNFNNCMIKKILCDTSSIGLRVLYGMDKNNRIHIILVGINAKDYSDLYVEQGNCCSGEDQATNKKLGAGLTGITAVDKGGAEYGQMP